MTISSPRAARSTDLDKRFLAWRLSTVVMGEISRKGSRQTGRRQREAWILCRAGGERASLGLVCPWVGGQTPGLWNSLRINHLPDCLLARADLSDISKHHDKGTYHVANDRRG